jgi:hypothetical protein
MVAVLALGACGLPGASTQTPSAATVLADVQSANIKDMTFTANGTLSFDLGSLAGATGSAGTNLSADGSLAGKITSSPQRADLALTVGSESFEVVTDAATQHGYISSPLLSQLFSSLGSGSSSCIALPIGNLATVVDTNAFTNFESLTQAKNIGSDNVNGASVWHLQGKQQYNGATATEDFYVRQDNSYPVRVVITGNANAPIGGTSGGSNPSANAKITIDFTHVNSGITISLPTNCQSFGG